MKIFDFFKTFDLIKNPLRHFNYVKVSEEELNQFTTNHIPNILSGTKDFEILLKQVDVQIVKRKYYEGIEKLREVAIRKHVSYFSLFCIAKHL